MRRRPLALPSLALTLALATWSCIMPFNGPSGVRRDVEEATGREYDCAFALTVGRSGLALVRRLATEDGEEPLPLKGLKKVEIGIYRVEERHDAYGGGDPIGGSPTGGGGIRAMEWSGWSPLVEVSGEGGQTVHVLAEAGRDQRVQRMLVVVEDGEDLVIVRMKGDLQELIEESIRYALSQADREELADPTIEEYHRGAGQDP